MPDRATGVITVEEKLDRNDTRIYTSAGTALFAHDWRLISNDPMRPGEDRDLEITVCSDCFFVQWFDRAQVLESYRKKLDYALPIVPAKLSQDKVDGMCVEVIRIVAVGGVGPETWALLSDGSALMIRAMRIELDFTGTSPREHLLTLRLHADSYVYSMEELPELPPED